MDIKSILSAGDKPIYASITNQGSASMVVGAALSLVGEELSKNLHPSTVQIIGWSLTLVGALWYMIGSRRTKGVLMEQNKQVLSTLNRVDTKINNIGPSV